MFPEEFTNRIRSQKYINSELLLQSLNEPSPVSIRLNPSKWTKSPDGSEPVPWCSDGWYLDKRPSFTLDPLFHSGCYYPQEASGMIIGTIFSRLSEGMNDLRVLDLCAAPGGKSTHLSSVIGRKGILVANEVIRSRAAILAGNITRWGIGNTVVTSADPSAFAAMQSYFDVVVADAPCSGEGMFRDQVAVKEWSVANTLLCAERQKRILADSWPALKENGILIYSTCTFNPSENEEQILWLLKNKRAESIRIDMGSYKGIKEIDYNGITGYGFHPGSVRGEGFFISVVRKLETEDKISRGSNLKTPAVNAREDIRRVIPLLSGEPGTIINRSGVLISSPLPPGELALISSRINILKPGTEIATIMKNDMVPTHEFILSDIASRTFLPTVELTLGQAVDFLRKEKLLPGGMPGGWVIPRYLGINIGLLKNIGSRINNYYPSGWRIRMAPDTGKLSNVIRWS